MGIFNLIAQKKAKIRDDALREARAEAHRNEAELEKLNKERERLEKQQALKYQVKKQKKEVRRLKHPVAHAIVSHIKKHADSRKATIRQRLRDNPDPMSNIFADAYGGKKLVKTNNFKPKNPFR